MPLILVAEDDASLRQILCTALLFAGFGVLEAEDGVEALRRTEEEKPDLILMDFGMPKMSGLECTALIKSRPEMRGTPIVAVTGFISIEERAAASVAGVDAFLPKPVDPRDVIAAVEAFVGPGAPGPDWRELLRPRGSDGRSELPPEVPPGA